MIQSAVLGTPAVIADLSVSPFSSVSFCFIYFGAMLLDAYMFIIVYLLDRMSFYTIVLLVPSHSFCLQGYYVRY